MALRGRHVSNMSYKRQQTVLLGPTVCTVLTYSELYCADLRKQKMVTNRKYLSHKIEPRFGQKSANFPPLPLPCALVAGCYEAVTGP